MPVRAKRYTAESDTKCESEPQHRAANIIHKPMSATQELLDSLRPTSGQLICDLVQYAGVDVAHWGIDRFNRAIDPHTNTYKNFQRAFGGGSDPWVACIWWHELKLISGLIFREGNSKVWRTRIAEP